MRLKTGLAEKIDQELEELEAEESKPVGTFKKLPPDRMEALILEHRDHGKRLAWSFLSAWRIRMKHDEVISVVGAALCEAANRFDETRGVAFKTFFFYHLRGMLLKEISRLINEQRVLQFYPHTTLTDYNGSENGGYGYQPPSLVPVEHNNPERIIEKREIANICWEACSKLDELEQEVLIRHFINDEPLIDIAGELNYCRCHISRVKSRGLAKLRKILKRSISGKNEAEESSALLEVANRRGLKHKAYTGGRGRRRIESPATPKERKLLVAKVA